jgi:cell wall-associated NlpC family hydrolase
MINLIWTYNPSTMRTADTSTTACPDWLSSYTSPISVGSIPYCWGGCYGDVSACGLTSFTNALSSYNYTAGNIDCDAGWVSGTAGVDCSGFISVAYRLSTKYNTTGLASYFTKLSSWSSIQAGDIFDYPASHVVMYYYNVYNSSGVLTSYETLEATTSGTDKAKEYVRTVAYIQTYYSPYTLN